MSIFTKAFNKLGGYDDWCVTIVVAQDGLRRAARLTCGDPAADTITVWQPVWDAGGPLWQAAWQTGG